MDVKDINGAYKKNRFGAKLSVDPEIAKQFAGVRRDSNGVLFNEPNSCMK
jgi:hypothetical protein